MTREEILARFGITTEKQLKDKLESIEEASRILLCDSGLTLDDLSEIIYNSIVDIATSVSKLMVAERAEMQRVLDTEVSLLSQQINRLAGEVATTDFQLRNEMRRRLSAAVPLDDLS